MSAPAGGFRHEMFGYRDRDAFLDRCGGFLAGAVAAGEPALAILSRPKTDALRVRLGALARQVRFADMAEVGANPARILPAWRRFVGDGSRPARGIGEPVWAAPSAAELAECRRHERLLDLAFADCTGFRLLCPYDASALPAGVLAAAAAGHPVVDGVANAAWRPPPVHSSEPLPPPTGVAEVVELEVAADALSWARDVVAARALQAGLEAPRSLALVVAANEVLTNSVQHGGGQGRLRMWQEAATLLVEVHDSGVIDDPLAGRVEPARDAVRGRGLWLVNQLCDLAQLRTGTTGTTVRLHLRVGG